MRFWRDLSISRKLYLVIGAMAVLIAGELLALRFAMSNLSAVRAFVGGESVWSKAQKNAAFRLQRFAVTRDEADYRAFMDYLSVPHGDHIARTELEKPAPDLATVRRGFLQGRIHGDDIDPLVALLRRFHWEPHVNRAIGIWREADRLLDLFEKTGAAYHDQIVSRSGDPATLASTFNELRELNERLTVLEEDFSAVLGEGSRWLEGAVMTLLFGAVLMVESVGLTLTFLTSRSISRGLGAINATAARIGRGEFRAPVSTEMRQSLESKDEIGQLARAILVTGNLLERSYQDLEARVQERTRDLEAMAQENGKLYRQAEDALQMRDEFLSVASHELKTPLTSLHLRFQLLRMQLAKAPPENELAKRVGELTEASLRDTVRLTRLLDELLDLTRLRLGKFEVKKERCDLAAVALDVIAQLGASAASAGSAVSFEAPEPVVGEFDPVRAAQIVTNLLSNAIKYGRGKPIQVAVRALGERAALEVRDAGVGIPASEQERIFERFERANENDAVAGLGLGLYITRQIVLAHGGTIRLRSDPGEGSVFTVELPRRSA